MTTSTTAVVPNFIRVKIAAHPPLPPVRVWFPLTHASTSTISSFKFLLCTSLVAFRSVSPSSLRFSVDGFELLDDSDLTVVRDGDLISVDVRKAAHEDATTRGTQPKHAQTVEGHASHDGPVPSRKRKRRTPTPSPSGFESDTESTTSSGSESDSASSETSESESVSDAHEASVQKATSPGVAAVVTPSIHPKPPSSTFVPPGYGKPQTRARNIRRRRKRMYEREPDGASGVPVSGANAVVALVQAVPDVSQGDSPLMSLSLRNKNKAKNFRSLMSRPLPPKIIFDEQEDVSTNGATQWRQGLARLIPPSSRSSLPPNIFVTSVDVEAEMHDEYGEEMEEEEEGAERLESMASEQWSTMERATRDNVAAGSLVGYKALGIDPTTCTPGHVLTVGRVESRDEIGVIVRPVRAAMAFGGSADAEAEQHPWEEIESGDWRRL